MGNDARWCCSIWDGYIAQNVCIDGKSIQNGDYSIGSFGEYNNNVWRPVDLTGLTFGNNGWLLDFADSSALGNDVSGNDNDFASSGLDADDQVTDTPTTNQCTLTPLNMYPSNITLSDGNLTDHQELYSLQVESGILKSHSIAEMQMNFLLGW